MCFLEKLMWQKAGSVDTEFRVTVSTSGGWGLLWGHTGRRLETKWRAFWGRQVGRWGNSNHLMLLLIYLSWGPLKTLKMFHLERRRPWDIAAVTSGSSLCTDTQKSQGNRLIRLKDILMVRTVPVWVGVWWSSEITKYGSIGFYHSLFHPFIHSANLYSLTNRQR